MRAQKPDNLLSILALCTAALVTFVGVVGVLRLRFEGGDMFPPYSSYRSEADGTKALYESLEQLPGVEVERFVAAVDQEVELPRATLMRLGISSPAYDVEDDVIHLRSGGRVVFGFVQGWFTKPVLAAPAITNAGSSNVVSASTNGFMAASNIVESVNSNGLQSATNALTTAEQEALDGIAELQQKRWTVFFSPLGFEVRQIITNEYVDAVRADAADPSLPDTIRLYEPYAFDPATNRFEDEWTTLYTVDGESVVMERNVQKGQLIVVGSSYPFSNKALRHDRATAFLTYVVGNPEKVFFDETHLGIAAHQGVATLIRKYNLEAVIAILLLVACLYIWKSTSRPVPSYAFSGWSKHQARQEGRDSMTGLETLMGRYIRPEELLKRLVVTYRDSRAGLPPLDEDVRAEVRRLVADSEYAASEEKDVETYKAICRIIKNKGAGHGP